ncbi:ATP/GTP-binding protein [Desulfovibrio sp. JC022]|uniref:AAA family ATPase n=1 Tax=Desulfovibrio sp. JC022 TaxID=2593642 RepID=UPI0013D88CA1|nr:ATP-binding protein [Desulfovibrio sp. JC022]
MLLEFSVANFRSIGEEQTLYMQPAFKSKDEDHNILETGIRREPQALPVVAILGANASGKSNILKALDTLRQIISISANRTKNDNYSDYSFKLNPDYSQKPTIFKIKFLSFGKIYTYHIEITPEAITKENLTVVSSAKGSRIKTLIKREGQKTEFHKSIYHKKSFLDLWSADLNKQQTALAYLSNKGEVDTLESVVEWFSITGLISPDARAHLVTANTIMRQNEKKDPILKYLQNADFNICDIKITKGNTAKEDLTEKQRELLQVTNGRFHPDLKTHFAHTDTEGKIIYLSLEKDESNGTKTYFALASLILSALQIGATMWIDELDLSLHPYLIRRIIQLFTNKETNPKGAQLIFTTHDVTVMDKSLLRPDEIYFTEKDKETFETKLYSLSEFKGMGSVSKNDRGEKLYKDYLNGRFGAVPDVDWEGGI